MSFSDKNRNKRRSTYMLRLSKLRQCVLRNHCKTRFGCFSINQRVLNITSEYIYIHLRGHPSCLLASVASQRESSEFSLHAQGFVSMGRGQMAHSKGTAMVMVGSSITGVRDA